MTRRGFLGTLAAGTVSLAESHMSIHTWPEYGRVNLDIYLSNFQRNNDGTVKNLYENFIRFFDAEVINEQTLNR